MNNSTLSVILYLPGTLCCSRMLLAIWMAVCLVQPTYAQLTDTPAAPIEFLKEMIVTPNTGKYLNKDTIHFKADDFRDVSTAVLEDLLRRMPGISIAADGSILVRGKKIDAVLLDGDDLYNKGYRVLSKNLAAGLIDKIQVIESYNPDELLRGIVNTHQKAINIVLKKDQKRPLTGNLIAGAGLHKRYDHSLNLIAYSRMLKVFYFQRYTNTGELLYSGDESGFLADPPVNVYKDKAGEFSADRSNLNKSVLHSLSFSSKADARVTLKGSASLVTGKNRSDETGSYFYHLRNVEIIRNEQAHYFQAPAQVNGNVRIAYRAGKSHRLAYSLGGKAGRNFSTAHILPGVNIFYNALRDRIDYSSHRIDHIWRLNKRSALRINAYQLYGNTRQHLRIMQEGERSRPLFDIVFPDSMHQRNGYRKNEAGILADYAYAKKNSQLGVAAHFSRQGQWMYSFLKTAPGVSLGKAGDNLANDGHLVLSRRRVSLRFSGTRACWQLAASLSGNYLEVGSPGFYHPDGILRKNNSYLEPRLQLKWQKNKHTVIGGYSCEALYSDLPEMHTNYLITDYRTLKKGYGDFYFSRPHSGSLEYSFSDLSRQFLTWFRLGFLLIENTPGYRFRNTQDMDLLERWGHTDQRYITFMAGIDKFISPLMSSVKFKGDVALNNSPYYQSNDLIPQHHLNMTSRLHLSFRSAFKRKFNYVAGVSLFCYGTATETERAVPRINYTRQLHFIDLLTSFSDKIDVQVTLEQVVFKECKRDKNNYCYMDLLMRYKLIRNKISFSLTGKNIGSKGNLVNTANADYFIQTRRYESAPAYLLIAINLRL